MRSARSRRNSSIISTIRGTPCSVKAPDTTGLLRVGQDQEEAPRVRDLCLDVLVGREGRRQVRRCAARPSPRRTYSTKSVVFGEAGLAGAVVEHACRPRRAGHEVDAVSAEVGVRVAVPVVQHERATGRRDRHARRLRVGTGPGRRPRSSAGRLRAAVGASRARGPPCRSRRGSASPRRECVRAGRRTGRSGVVASRSSVPQHRSAARARPA